jgi:hypothetical protein
MELTAEDLEWLDALDMYQETEWFVEVSKLTPGRTFGELALLKDAPRAATIHCICNCYFATLNRADF